MFEAWTADEESTKAGGVQLLRDLMMYQNPNYAAFRPSHVIFTKSITEYFLVAAAAEVGVVLNCFLNLDMDGVPHTAYLLNDTSLNDTNCIISRVVTDVAVHRERLQCRFIDSVGDQFTNRDT